MGRAIAIVLVMALFIECVFFSCSGDDITSDRGIGDISVMTSVRYFTSENVTIEGADWVDVGSSQTYILTVNNYTGETRVSIDWDDHTYTNCSLKPGHPYALCHIWNYFGEYRIAFAFQDGYGVPLITVFFNVTVLDLTPTWDHTTYPVDKPDDEKDTNSGYVGCMFCIAVLIGAVLIVGFLVWRAKLFLNRGHFFEREIRPVYLSKREVMEETDEDRGSYKNENAIARWFRMKREYEEEEKRSRRRILD